MAISLSTSLCTSLATSLCGDDVPVIQANHLNVEYSISGTTSHLNFLRYPQADVTIGETTYYAWKCCDTELIATLYSDKVEELQLGDTLWKYENGQVVQSDGVIETRDMSIWSDEFTVLVLDEITEANSDRVYIYVNGASYYNAYQSFVIAPARYGDTIRLYIHEASTYAPYWSDGSTARERYITIDPYSYGYQITRTYPAAQL